MEYQFRKSQSLRSNLVLIVAVFLVAATFITSKSASLASSTWAAHGTINTASFASSDIVGDDEGWSCTVSPATTMAAGDEMVLIEWGFEPNLPVTPSDTENNVWDSQHEYVIPPQGVSPTPDQLYFYVFTCKLTHQLTSSDTITVADGVYGASGLCGQAYDFPSGYTKGGLYAVGEYVNSNIGMPPYYTQSVPAAIGSNLYIAFMLADVAGKITPLGESGHTLYTLGTLEPAAYASYGYYTMNSTSNTGPGNNFGFNTQNVPNAYEAILLDFTVKQ